MIVPLVWCDTKSTSIVTDRVELAFAGGDGHQSQLVVCGSLSGAGGGQCITARRLRCEGWVRDRSVADVEFLYSFFFRSL